MFGANYKLKTGMFRRFVVQQTQYVLSNGVTFENEKTKEKLGSDFDYKVQKAAKKALVDGVSFCFWNYDHVEVFGLADTSKEPGFVPLYDEDNGSLRAGIRYWSSATKETNRYTLYELDGYTEYIKRKDEDAEVLKDKQKYIKTTKSTKAGGVEAEAGENYPGFPIIPMYANDARESEIVGLREALDCYDLIKSGFANNIEQATEIFWLIKNAGGMDDIDLTQFLERMRVVNAASLPDGVEADAHTMTIPTEAREKMLALLKTDLYEDAQIVDVKALSAGSKTATEIRAAYQPMDDKCGDFEYEIREFIRKLFELIGIDDEPSFKWNRIANQTEETQMVLSAANYLDDEAVLKHLPWLTPEEVDEILARNDAENAERLNAQIDQIEEEFQTVTEE
jgi:SPP1 family phage portal protein